MGKTFSTICAFLAALVIAVAPHIARAGTDYTFIKIACRPDLKLLTISVFHDSDEAGKKLLEQPKMDVYYLRDLSIKDQNLHCDISSEQTISLRAAEPDDMPSKSFFGLKLNGQTFSRGSYPLGYGDFSLTIQETDPRRYTTRLCPDEPESFFNHADEINGLKSPCEVSHVLEGKNESVEFVETR